MLLLIFVRSHSSSEISLQDLNEESQSVLILPFMVSSVCVRVFSGLLESRKRHCSGCDLQTVRIRSLFLSAFFTTA